MVARAALTKLILNERVTVKAIAHRQPSSSILDLNDTHINAGLISILLHLKRHFSASEACPSINGANEEEEKRRGAKGVGIFLSCCLCLSSAPSHDISLCDKLHW